jgi:hypothetical protein
MPPTGPPPATLAEIESLMVQQGYKPNQVAAFAKWYAAAKKKDPSITPLDAYTAWAVGTDVSAGASAETGLLGGVINKGLPAAAAAVPSIPDPLAGIAGALEAFFQALTDGKMWRSLGWIILGIVLLILGVLLWIGPAAERRSPFGIAGGVARRAYG